MSEAIIYLTIQNRNKIKKLQKTSVDKTIAATAYAVTF